MRIHPEEVIAIVKETRELFLGGADRLQITEKGSCDYVTQIDVQVQSFVTRRLAERYPQVQLMGEEKDNSEIDASGDFWILDPVDGTTNLIHDFQHSTLSLAYVEDGALTFGVVYHPNSGEVFTAVRGQGAFLNGRPIHVSGAGTLSESLISIGTSPYSHELADRNFAAFKRIFLACQDIRRLGSAAMDMAYVACGRDEAFFERSLKPWDFAAGRLLVEEAGGTVCDFEGKPVPLTEKADVVATNGKITRELLALLGEME
ncbi:MAG: inositol monophosphatase family protein [Eubacteriales bacterium]|nr:inositol monophosphatase family protein [Eubacteriales bacterium]